MISNFPNSLDDDSTLPRVDDNISEIGAEAINATRSAIFSLEEEVGLGGRGSLASIADRIAVSIDQDGLIIPSALAGIGLVSLPITNSEISATASIAESKLSLTYSTSSLYSFYTVLSNSVDILNSFLALTGIKINPHIAGTDYKHYLSHIAIETPLFKQTNPIATEISPGTSVINRNTTNLETLLTDINDDLVIHEKSDGSSGVTATSGGTVPPLDFAHNASGIHVITSNFGSIPQSNTDVQKVVDFIDSSSLLLIGDRTRNLFSNGVSRHSRSSLPLLDGYSTLLVPPTKVSAYHLNDPPGPTSIIPIDSIDNGDDVILFKPTAEQLSGYNFDAQFSLVSPGDLLTINYGTGIAYQFAVESIKAVPDDTNSLYAVRINGRNTFGTSDGYAQINKALFSRNKQHVLASARVPNNVSAYESLIVASPRGAMTLGTNFNPSQLSATHYKLYLCLYQVGDMSSTFVLPGIDVTGNAGITPGKYTLQSIIDSTNTAFRAAGYNFRFIAFDYNGQFGIALADHYLNSGFSIIGGVVGNSGEYTSNSNLSFPRNVVDNYNSIDPLGLGVLGSNVASPPPSGAYSHAESAFNSPTIIFTPLKKNFFYVDGSERDTIYSDPLNLVSNVDAYGDGYFPAIILPLPTTQILSSRIKSVYQVSKDISKSGLRAGKTIVVQPSFPITDTRFNLRDYGRFIVESVSYFNCGELDGYSNITVYDSVHGNGSSPGAISTNIPVGIYFTDDSLAFNAQNVADENPIGNCKRFFENYIDKNGHTFTHERARFLTGVDFIGNINIYNISPKLKGYSSSSGAYREIRLILDFKNATTHIYSGYLVRWDGASYSNNGPLTEGKAGEIVRFYDETNIDYIDFIFDLSIAMPELEGQIIDIQLFDSLSLNQEEMLLSTCQMNDNGKTITYLQDQREFGNISEEHLSSSALDWISAVSQIMFKNRVVRGFDLVGDGVSGNNILLTGGVALIDGRIIEINPSTVTIPILQEWVSPADLYPTISWFLCANKKGQVELVAETTSQGAGLDADRIYYVKNTNIVSPIAYPIKATAEANLKSNSTSKYFRDLIVLYRVEANVSGSGSTWTLDALTSPGPEDLRTTFARI